MDNGVLVALFNNATLLLVLSVIYDVVYFVPQRYRRWQRILSGIMISIICSIVMLVPFTLQSGIIFDTRSIVISLAALFFGLVPTSIVVAVATIIRLFIGGSGTLVGVLVILTSALIGLSWRHFLYPKVIKLRWLSVFIMSIIVHIIMLACMLLLPQPDNINVIHTITIPVLLVYPAATVVLGLLLMRQQTLRNTQEQLKQSEERFKLLFEKAPMGYQSLDLDGNFIDVNQQWCELLGYSRDEVIGKWFGDFLSPENKEAFRARFPVFKEQGFIHSEFEVLHKNGNVLFIKFEGKIGYGVDHEFVQTHCILQDITNQKAAEAALIESEKKYRNIAENMSDVVWQADLNLRTTYISPSVQKLLGESPEEHMSRSLEEKLPEQTLKYLGSVLLEELEKEKDISVPKDRSRLIEVEHYRADGSMKWIEMSIAITRDHQGNAIGITGVSRDITQRKLAEIALKESERSKSVLLNNLPGMAYRCNYDRDWTMQFVSDGCYKLTGYSPDMLINNRDISFNDIIAPEYREQLRNEWAHIFHKKLPFRSEYEIITADGNCKWVLEMGEGVYDARGEVEALEGIILDITDRKKVEDQLQKSLNRTQSMINNHQAVMLLIEPITGDIIEANQAAIDFYGYTKDELLHMTIQNINFLDPDEMRLLSMKVLEKGKKYFTFPHRLKNGETRIVDVYSSPIEYDDQKVLFSIIFDVTKREEIAKQNEYLAYHDYLTGLYNRRYYEEEFQRRTEGDEFPIGLFLGDVDGFKEYNDTYGHAEGDNVLRKISQNLRTLVGQDGILARVGGDEFAIIVSGKDHLGMRKYLDMLNNEYDNAPSDLAANELPTVSWGYSLQRHQQDTLDNLEEEAEAFMYNRKFYSHQSMRSRTVNAIIETLFTKSEREKDHSERVGLLSEAIAKQMQLSSADIDKIRVAGFLHDIGKIGIDEAILNKEGKLNVSEWEIMKLHPAKSAGILDKTREYQDISDIVLSHHERFDGNGYPGKLQGEAIPLEARIIAVADTYDAITNDRPYKKAMDKHAAIAELKKVAGTQLDPEVVSVFINTVLNEIEQGNMKD